MVLINITNIRITIATSNHPFKTHKIRLLLLIINSSSNNNNSSKTYKTVNTNSTIIPLILINLRILLQMQINGMQVVKSILIVQDKYGHRMFPINLLIKITFLTLYSRRLRILVNQPDNSIILIQVMITIFSTIKFLKISIINSSRTSSISVKTSWIHK